MPAKPERIVGLQVLGQRADYCKSARNGPITRAQPRADNATTSIPAWPIGIYCPPPVAERSLHIANRTNLIRSCLPHGSSAGSVREVLQKPLRRVVMVRG